MLKEITVGASVLGKAPVKKTMLLMALPTSRSF